MSGAFFCIVGGIGLHRLPDFFSRMHGAGVTDTLGAGLVLGGLMLQAGWTLVLVKLVFVLALLWITGPTAAHAHRQGRPSRTGLEPYTTEAEEPHAAKRGRPLLTGLMIDLKPRLIFLAGIAVAVARLRNLLAVVVFMGFYSLVTAALFTVLDAVDVAFTEAAVGAGVSTVIMLGTLLLLTTRAGGGRPSDCGTLPRGGDHRGRPGLRNPRHARATGTPRRRSTSTWRRATSSARGEEIGVPNIVTSVLASYRGYDTLGELTVIFTARRRRCCCSWAAGRGPGTGRADPVSHHLILRVVAKLLIPFILLFGLYVQFHGDYGPGGGVPGRRDLRRRLRPLRPRLRRRGGPPDRPGPTARGGDRRRRAALRGDRSGEHAAGRPPSSTTTSSPPIPWRASTTASCSSSSAWGSAWPPVMITVFLAFAGRKGDPCTSD